MLPTLLNSRRYSSSVIVRDGVPKPCCEVEPKQTRDCFACARNDMVCVRDTIDERRSAGFTLIEVIMAVAIIAIIAAMVYSSLWGVMNTIGDTREKMELC